MKSRPTLLALTAFALTVLLAVGINLAQDEKPKADPSAKPAAEKAEPTKKEEEKPTLAVKPIKRLSGFDDWVTSAAFSPDGSLVATGTYERFTLWDGKTGEKKSDVTAKFGRIRALAFSADGSNIIAGGFRKIGIWKVPSGELLKELEGHRAYVTDFSMSPDGKLLASSSEDTTVRIWNLDTGESTVFVTEKEDPVMGVAFSPDGEFIATASGDDTRQTRPGHVKLYSVKTGELVREFAKHDRVATKVRFSPDGKLLASTSFDEKVLIHEVESGKPVGLYEEHGRPTNGVSFLPGGKRLVSIGGGRAVGHDDVHVWDRETGGTLALLELHKAPVVDLAVSPDGTRFVTVGRDELAILWSIPEEPSTTPATTVAAADTGKKPAAGTTTDEPKATDEKVLRIGMIGLDTSHCLAFSKILNMKDDPGYLPGCKVVGVYPKGSPDIESSTSRVPNYTVDIQKYGVKIVDSIDELLTMCDAVLLETNDGRPHLEQVAPCLKAGKRVFIDKPIAGSLVDAITIFELARHYKTPLFSSSSLRFSSGAQAIRSGDQGKVIGCDAYSPCSLEKTHPDLYWYGIHGVETLFTVMGEGCESVTRTHTEDTDFVVGLWKGGRIGTFRGIRKGGSGYGATAFCEKGVVQVGKYEGYRPLVVEYVKFFNGGDVPVSEQETLEIYAFMTAADESKRLGGVPVKLADVIAKARAEAKTKVDQLTKGE
ncbi:MAG: Gfo/Idh/MocA family oxidoreductase [Planctomycetota bacterium]|nr:Gfo/Idh/MocA family oxidoreductase [Planctomycetota bacterium]MDA1248058.1 Gfo/Idh/MocA family oxidoreductase [Planctomycetota bacterium]